MIVAFGLGYLVLALVLFLGQLRVIKHAWCERKAGIGRFSYALKGQPIRFWIVLVLECVGLLLVASYVIGGILELQL